MKVYKKFAKLSLTMGALMFGVLLIGSRVQADQNQGVIQEKSLTKPYVVYGAGAVQKTQVAQTLGINDNYQKLVTQASDGKYLGLNQLKQSDMVPSVSIAPAKNKTGNLVNIEKFEGDKNITHVFAQEYAMAATLGGAKDLIMTFTSDKRVMGTDALVGVYQALDEDGTPLDPTNTTAANRVMEATINGIAPNNMNDRYIGKLTSAITMTAGELAKRRQTGDTIDINVVYNQLTVNLEQRNIRNEVSDDQMNQLSMALQQYNQAPISDAKPIVSRTSALADKLEKTTNNKMAGASDFKNEADAHNASNWFVSNIWNPFIQFLRGK
ncbi:DUF1002 domain-containing protein [Weissella viridescens]|uniref:DUF1002 domain-containing protein n=1 Tax=Weissella viridescens TaxID=1629 RepID=A0A3P2RFA0_WEIVI|nr:DUF1002 domain-containing protein [Weissella viridescens]RRG18125.1 DUF1002 domain-containing protein [Weissella viridescens]